MVSREGNASVTGRWRVNVTDVHLVGEENRVAFTSGCCANIIFGVRRVRKDDKVVQGFGNRFKLRIELISQVSIR